MSVAEPQPAAPKPKLRWFQYSLRSLLLITLLLSQLRRLDLENTKVTDAGLEHLKGLNQLHALSLYGTRVTEAGANKLRKALPRNGISRDFWISRDIWPRTND